MAAATVLLPPLVKRALSQASAPNPKRRGTQFAALDPSSSLNFTSNDIGSQDSTSKTTSTAKKPTAPRRDKRLACPYDDCSRVFNRPSLLDEHIRSHTGDRPFPCLYPDCDSAFQRQWHLDRHVKLQHSEGDHACPREGCEKSFNSSADLQKHVNGRHDRQGKHKCIGFAHCSQTFRKAVTLQRHVDKDHLKKDPFRCTKRCNESGRPCKATFNTKKKLKSHERSVHQSGAEQQYWCTLCASNPDKPGKGFAQLFNLQRHIESHHVEEFKKELREDVESPQGETVSDCLKTFTCTESGCGRSFTRKRNLTSHTRLCHKDRLECGVFDLSRSKGLENWDGKNACGKTFTSKLGLEKHVRRQHLGEPARVFKPKSKSDRPERKTADSSLLSKLTGQGYAEESGRHIPCLVENCNYRFTRHYDLEVHFAAFHGGDDGGDGDGDQGNLAEITREQEALNGGRFWVGGDDDNLDEPSSQDIGYGRALVDGFEEPVFADAEPFDFFSQHGANDSFVHCGTNISDAIDPALVHPQTQY